MGHVRLAEFRARYLDFAPSEMRSRCCVSAWSNLCFLLLTLAASCKQFTEVPGGETKVHETAAAIQESVPEAWTRTVVMEARAMKMNDHN